MLLNSPGTLERPAKGAHITVQIKHDFELKPMPNNGWFPGTSVDEVYLVHWQNKQFPGDKGEYCVGEDPETGIIWFHDGKDRIAAVNKWRIRRYLYRGLDHRYRVLLRDYLGNGLIDIPNGVTIFNFGANIGEVALALSRMDALVIAIEPDPNVLPALKANAKGRYITVWPYVAWKTKESIDLYIATRRGDTSVINESPEKIQVEAVDIDSLYFPSPYLILGDAEGAEPEVLMGAKDTLTRTKYVSIRVGQERAGRCSGPECREILEDAGFKILQDENEILIGENVEYQD